MNTRLQQNPALKKAWAQDYQIELFGGKSINLKPADIPRLLRCENASIQECVLFLKQCQQYGADPFMRDMYIIKYGSKPASNVTGVGFFQKKAQQNPNFEGFTPTEWLSGQIGKWVQCWIPSLHGKHPLGCRVSCHVKGYREKQTFTVNWEENKKETNTWKGMPSRMLEKVAMVGLLRQTFPADFSGLYIQEEIDGNSDKVDSTVAPASMVYEEELAASALLAEPTSEPVKTENVAKAQRQEIDPALKVADSEKSLGAEQSVKTEQPIEIDMTHCDICENKIDSRIFVKHYNSCQVLKDSAEQATLDEEARIAEEKQKAEDAANTGSEPIDEIPF